MIRGLANRSKCFIRVRNEVYMLARIAFYVSLPICLRDLLPRFATVSLEPQRDRRYHNFISDLTNLIFSTTGKWRMTYIATRNRISYIDRARVATVQPI